ncbi:MAG: hypothetical protein HZB68_03030 [Candidatus Aenigmarchaeota archaeon]|nr:hypothetical protein [Candidatus Aenigmarchaeota archaeon]
MRLALFLLAIILVAGCAQQKASTTTTLFQSGNAPQGNTLTGPFKGVSFSPKSFGAEDFVQFFATAKETGNMVTWAGDWNQLGDATSAPYSIAQLSRSNGIEPLAIASYYSQGEGRMLRQLTDEARKNYIEYAARFAEKYKPKYLAFGIEVNIMREKSPEDFEAFVSLFPDVYDAVKAKSPETTVFTIFQLERIKGMKGGLFGGKNDPSKTEWDILEKFPKADLVGFTTYPGLVYGSPSNLKDDYYSEIKSHVSKPVAFTEIGWHSAASPYGWESSESEQADFVKAFFNLTGSLDTKIAIWSFAYDPDTKDPFKGIGLITKDGKKKLSWQQWLNGRL